MEHISLCSKIAFKMNINLTSDYTSLFSWRWKSQCMFFSDTVCISRVRTHWRKMQQSHIHFKRTENHCTVMSTLQRDISCKHFFKFQSFSRVNAILHFTDHQNASTQAWSTRVNVDRDLSGTVNFVSVSIHNSSF